MSSPFVGQLLAVGFNFAPTGWALAAGQLLPISQNTALFSLLGTFYGGDGKSNFALPNMQGNIAVGSGQGPGLSDYALGQASGSEVITLLNSEYPGHTHQIGIKSGRGSGGTATSPANGVISTVGGGSPPNVFAAGGGSLNSSLSPSALTPAGGSQPHNNMMPYLCINWIIALQGVFPSRS